jgi:cyclophilin family peptidyl-prolyl cis-trans isomerase
MYPIPDQTSGELKASGSQFFISLVELPTEGTPINVLGKVIEGLEIVGLLEPGDAVESITISEK